MKKPKTEPPQNPKPNPGSDAAIALGCKCPVLDNARGMGHMGQPGVFVRNQDCPLHGAGSSTWERFFFESNQFFQYIGDEGGWQRLRDAYPDLSDDDLLDAKEATYHGTRDCKERLQRPNYGFRLEHDGEKTLRDFFRDHGMELPPGENTKHDV